MKNFKDFIIEEDGLALSEYALVLGLVALVAIVGLTAFGNAIKETFAKITSALTGK